MTRSTFAGFTIAQLGMNASQRALQVTGQNISNINTEGYTRQRLDLVSLNLRGGEYVSSGISNKIGYGVEITNISQIRDPFLDIQYRNQIAKVGTADSRQDVLDQLGNIFDETDSDALKTALSNLESSLKNLSANANNDEFDSIVRSRCQVILNYIHQKKSDLTNLRTETISGLENTDIPHVNSLLSDIGELNDAIWKSQVLGNPALELKDQRNTKLDELASYLPISVTYKDVVVSGTTTFEYPVVKFVGSDGLKYNLTAGEHGENVATFSLEHNKDSKGEEDGTVSLSLIPASDFPSESDTSTLKTDITDSLKEGIFKGTLDMLNKSGELDNPASDYRGIGYYEKVFDAFVQSFAQTFNELNKNTVPYTGAESIPSIGASTKNAADKAEYTIDFSKASGNFLNSEKITINGSTFTFYDGSSNTVQLSTDFDVNLQRLAEKMNADTGCKTMTIDGNSVTGQWAYDPATQKLTWTSDDTITGNGENVKAGDGSELLLQYKANPSNIKNFDLFKTTDGTTIFTADNIKIADEWMNNKIYIIASHEENAGSTANDNILKMINALNAERDFTYEYTYTDAAGNSQTGSINFYNGNFAQCYCNMENMQGLDSSSNTAILKNHTTVINQTADNRDAVSGVSLDEEGINLMQYQRSYTAAARLMTTLDEALDVLINNTGIVGR